MHRGPIHVGEVHFGAFFCTRGISGVHYIYINERLNDTEWLCVWSCAK